MHQAQINESGPQKTAVTVSMQTMNESMVRYRESDKEYSFQA